MPIGDRDILFANAEMDFVDLIETSKEEKSSTAHINSAGTTTRARQCEAKDFENNDSTKGFYEVHKKYIMLCPAQDDLYMTNNLEDMNYHRRFDF